MEQRHSPQAAPEEAATGTTTEVTKVTTEPESATFFSRRDLLRLGGTGAMAVAAGGALTSARPVLALKDSGVEQVGRVIAHDLTRDDIDTLNFALHLEYFEAEFYTYALTGQGIESIGIRTDGQGAQGPTTGGSRVEFTDPIVRAVAEELAYDEQQHVKLLRRVLGSKAVAKPAIALNGKGFGFGSEAEYLQLSRATEDTGTTAYVGGAHKLSRHLLTAAAGITADEAYHMGNVRLLIAQKNIPTVAVDAKDILPPPSGKKFFAVDAFAMALPRTMQEVIPIVRPHFPSGFNSAQT